MTTLYRPVLIESAEQAEGLPIGTVAVNLHDADAYFGEYVTWRTSEGWADTHEQATRDMGHAEVVGLTALVPIEAEEETTNRWDEGDPVNDITTKYRYVTPWEEA